MIPTWLFRALPAAVLAASAMVLGGCWEEQGPESRAAERSTEPVTVTVQPARTEAVPRTIDVVGTLWGDEQVTLSAKVAGRIVAIYKDIGDRVQPGEALAQIDKTDYLLMVRQKELAIREILAKLGLKELPGGDFDPSMIPAVERARLQAANAEAKFNRGKQLHEQEPPLLSDQDFADLRTAAAVARSNHEVELLNSEALLAEADARVADLEMARQRLADTLILAPEPLSGGVSAEAENGGGDSSYAISERSVSIGEYAREGTALFRLVDDDPVKLRATAAEKHVSAIRVGQGARVRLEAYEQEFRGRVARINPQIDAASRTFQIEIVIPNPERLLKPGAFAKAAVEMRVDEEAVFVPRSSIVSFAGVSKVFVVRDGKAVDIAVRPGAQRGEYVEVSFPEREKRFGADEGLVVEGVHRLWSGAPVSIASAAGQ